MNFASINAAPRPGTHASRVAPRLGGPSPDGAVATAGRRTASASFNQLLRTTTTSGKTGSASPASSRAGDDQARTAAEKLVSSALIMPLLKEIRHQPLQTKLFHSGPGGDAFRQRLDIILADRIVQSEHFPLVGQVRKQIQSKATALGAAQARTVGGKVNTHG